MFLNKDGTVRQPWAFFVWYFNRKVKPLYHPDQGRDMILIAVVFEVIRVAITLYKNNLGYTDILSTGITALILLFLVYAVTRYVFPIKLKDIGLRNFKTWNSYETVYLLIMVPVGFFVFWYYTRNKLMASYNENGPGLLFVTFIFYIAWGFYQEWIYRGLLQTEFTRRFGGAAAVLLANLLFTFGPLHIYQLYEGKYMLIGATFLIGLVFGIIYQRSYNLWIVGILHGIGNWFLVGLP